MGCGTAVKLIKLSPTVNFLIGLEPNDQMLKTALSNIENKKISNALLVRGFAEGLPFKDNQFDIVTVMLAPHNTKEVYRVLKPNGYAIVEKIGNNDKQELKNFFGKDSLGWRGYLCGTSQENRISTYNREFGDLFREFKILNGEWDTYYSKEGLTLLLEETPTIRNFDITNDKNILTAYAKKYSTKKGIPVKQNRILIIARK